MTISLISSDHVTANLVNSFSSSVTANAGDVIELALQYREIPTANFVPVWNGQAFIEMSPRVSIAGFHFHRFYLKANTTATANITGGTSPDYVTLNRSWKVWRSSGNSFPTNPIKAGSYQAVVYSSGTYTNPSITNTLSSGEVVSAVFASPNWDTGYGTGVATFSENPPSVNIGECVSTYIGYVEILRSFYTEGSGSVTSSLTKTGSHNPMYQFSTAILQETLYSITSINGGNPITVGQTNIPIVTSGFTAKPTGVTVTHSGGTLTATIGAGSATNFVIDLQDRVEGEDWPVNGSNVSFTFTYGAESASLNQIVVGKVGEVVYTFVGVITTDPSSIGYHLAADGFTVEGGEHTYIPYGDLVLAADGTGLATNVGTFSSWFRPSTGTGAGNIYQYTWNISEAGIAPVEVVKTISLGVGYGLGI